jgi:FlaA1/EpsC-like NDP-sugar epimerase
MAPRYESLFDLRGRVVLVAGGGGAIGSEMARAVAAIGSETMALVVDVVDEPSVARAVAGAA